MPFRHDHGGRLADHLALGIAEYPLGAGVPRSNGAVERAADDRIVGILDDRGEPGALGLGALALRDVTEHQ